MSSRTEGRICFMLLSSFSAYGGRIQTDLDGVQATIPFARLRERRQRRINSAACSGNKAFAKARAAARVCSRAMSAIAGKLRRATRTDTVSRVVVAQSNL